MPTVSFAIPVSALVDMKDGSTYDIDEVRFTSSARPAHYDRYLELWNGLEGVLHSAAPYDSLQEVAEHLTRHALCYLRRGNDLSMVTVIAAPILVTVTVDEVVLHDLTVAGWLGQLDRANRTEQWYQLIGQEEV
jgi:hypothetical protein